MAQGHKFQDLEETGEALVGFINSSQLESLSRVKQEHQELFDQQTHTAQTLIHILKDVARIEENVGQTLLDTEKEKKENERQLESLEEQLRRCTAKGQMTDSEIQFLQRELESVRNADHELKTQQNEVDQDTTEIIPSALHVAQLYHKITKIRWEYDTAPNILQAVHYGADLATPISMDSSTQSRADISEQLWGFVSTQW
ncbi:kinetochore protein Spc24 [Gouania willdenowi]|uniref:Kinetochore protein Spc24 n=1 Tax=Gouania willdenowi TaxID=441366 RepID=A0A8C5G309_GOUWI|nr:kinetochore protein Spc24 [Gouania willdenowi]